MDDRTLTPPEALKPTLQDAYGAFIDLIRFLRTRYVMDELWDGQHELKFRRGGKTLVTLQPKEGFFTALVIFGKAERAQFEAEQETFSPFIRAYYDGSTTYHDGKWMFIDVRDGAPQAELQRLIQIKKKPNRRDKYNPGLLGRCGNSCGDCLLFIRNNEGDRHDSRVFHEMDRCCYGAPGDRRKDYTHVSCPGCAAKKTTDCALIRCATKKGHQSCLACDYHHCEVKGGLLAVFDPAHCNLGLRAEEITHAVMPYCGKQRLDALRLKQASR